MSRCYFSLVDGFIVSIAVSLLPTCFYSIFSRLFSFLVSSLFLSMVMSILRSDSHTELLFVPLCYYYYLFSYLNE
jgi:hypothetical protein